jgi:hypothetical protein
MLKTGKFNIAFGAETAQEEMSGLEGVTSSPANSNSKEA